VSATERLQKAAEATIAAGYQLDRDAFELLSLAALTDDPTAIVNEALLKIRGLEEKPFFIDKAFLENVIQKQESAEELPVHPREEPI